MFLCFVLYLFYLCFTELLEYVNSSLLSNSGMFQPLFLQIFILTFSLRLWYSNYTYARYFLIVTQALKSHTCVSEGVSGDSPIPFPIFLTHT